MKLTPITRNQPALMFPINTYEELKYFVEQEKEPMTCPKRAAMLGLATIIFMEARSDPDMMVDDKLARTLLGKEADIPGGMLLDASTIAIIIRDAPVPEAYVNDTEDGFLFPMDGIKDILVDHERDAGSYTVPQLIGCTGLMVSEWYTAMVKERNITEAIPKKEVGDLLKANGVSDSIVEITASKTEEAVQFTSKKNSLYRKKTKALSKKAEKTKTAEDEHPEEWKSKAMAMVFNVPVDVDIVYLNSNSAALKPELAEKIDKMNKREKIGFSTLKNLHSGRDEWTGLREDKLQERFNENVQTYIKSILDYDKNVFNALRWYGRGLRIEHAIRKAMVDQELADERVRDAKKTRKY